MPARKLTKRATKVPWSGLPHYGNAEVIFRPAVQNSGKVDLSTEKSYRQNSPTPPQFIGIEDVISTINTYLSNPSGIYETNFNSGNHIAFTPLESSYTRYDSESGWAVFSSPIVTSVAISPNDVSTSPLPQ